MNYSALIFDMDGTIVHNMYFHNQAWKDVLAEAGVQIDMDEFHRATTGKTNTEILRMMLGPGVSEAEIDEWGRRKEALYRERFLCCREPLPGLLDLLEQARAAGLKLAVATAAPPANITFILDELDLRRRFDVVVGGHQIKHGKPDPEIFLLAASMVDTPPARCLVFEDAPSGIEAARRAGMQAILICTTIAPDEVTGQPHVLDTVPDFTHIDLKKLLGN